LGTLAFGTCLVSSPTLAASENAKPKKWAEGHILVQPRAGLSEAEFDGVLKKNGGKRLGKLRKLGVHMIQVPPQAEEKIAAALAKHPWVEFAEVDMAVEPIGVPDDPRYGSQWFLPKIQAPEAWDYATGAGVVVAVLDTGVDGNHPDLAGKMVPGWNAYDGNSNSADVHGHGTWVAGVVAAETNNGIGVAGVAADALIMPVRISQPDGFAYWSTVASGLSWAADHGAQVANISYNNVSGSSSVQSAARYLRRKGGLTVVAAGNSGGQVNISESPDLITAAATTSNDARAGYSSYGEYVDVAAPGSGILTTSRGGGYSSVSGTSFASPCTAGVIALVMGANPRLSPSEVETILFETTEDKGNLGWDMYYGHGRVDALAAVQLAQQTSASDTVAPSVTIVSPRSGTVSQLVSVDVQATDNVGVTHVELYVNSSFFATDGSPPFRFTWDSTQYPEGAADLHARAHDAAGNYSDSRIETVTVDNLPDPVDETPPTVAITSPGDRTSISGRVRITATASDDTGVTLLEVLLDDSVICAGNTTALSCPWNARKAVAGTHIIQARARDAAGNITTSSIQVEVATHSGAGGGKGKGKKK
jgi:subtilisin family serine protease